MSDQELRDKVVGNATKSVKTFYYLCLAYVATGWVMDLDRLTLLVMTVGMFGFYTLFVHNATPKLISRGSGNDILKDNLVNVSLIFALACTSRMFGLDSFTIGVSVAVLWHVQIFAMIFLTNFTGILKEERETVNE